MSGLVRRWILASALAVAGVAGPAAAEAPDRTGTATRSATVATAATVGAAPREAAGAGAAQLVAGSATAVPVVAGAVAGGPTIGGPVLDAAPLAPAQARAVAAEDRRRYLLKTVVGLLALMALVYVGGHPRVRAWEERAGVLHLATAGFPFVALGLLARRPEVGVLTDDVLTDLSPVLRLGLGWIGFMVGFRFDLRALDALPVGTATLIVLRTLAPFALVAVAAGSALYALEAGDEWLRGALVLATAGAMTASTASPDRAWTRVLRLEELGAIAGLIVLAAFFRPAGDATWQLPGMAWLLLSLGLGVTVGVVMYAILRVPADAAESVVLILGSIAFSAGMAGALRLSPVSCCFVAGALLVNLPGAYKARVLDALRRLERPIYLLFLVVVGAVWEVTRTDGWVLMVVFLVTRMAGKWLGDQVAARVMATPAPSTPLLAPLGSLSIAIVVDSLLLGPAGHAALLATSVIGGAIITEFGAQLGRRRAARGAA